MANALINISTAVSVVVLFAAGAQGQGTNLGTPMQQSPAAETKPGSSPIKSDEDFVTRAAIANRFEVLEGELALALASDPKLKEFAQMMVADHTAALKDLRKAASNGGVKVSEDIALDPAHQAKLDALKGRKADFDQAYLGDQVQAHVEALSLLETYQKTGRNDSLKAWASKAVEKVKLHQDHLRKLGTK